MTMSSDAPLGFCQFCGARRIMAGQGFCGRCGQQLSDVAPAVTAAAPATPPPHEPAPPPPEPIPPTPFAEAVVWAATPGTAPVPPPPAPIQPGPTPGGLPPVPASGYTQPSWSQLQGWAPPPPPAALPVAYASPPNAALRNQTPILLGLGVVGLVVVVVVAMMLSAGGSHARPGSSALALATPTAGATVTTTPTPTAEPTPTPTVVPTAEPTPRAFVITDSNFVPGVPDSCDGDSQITAVSGTGLTVSGTISMINSQFVVFCYGAKTTWIGTLTYVGYTFASDAADPLQFTVVRDQGYVYTGGKGTVTSPDGSVVTLPN